MTTRLIVLLLLIVCAGAAGHYWIAGNPELQTVKKQDYTNYVEIPPGEFMMGCSDGDKECEPNERPSHRVILTKRFWMMRTEVTVGEFKKFVYVTDGRKMPADPPFNQGWQDDQMPMIAINWSAARAYCEWAGGRLPTEVEWEYAARAGDTSARYGIPGSIAWYADNSEAPNRVGLKPANRFQLYDTLGNVWEWVNDRYDENYYRQSPLRDPPGPATGDRHIVRGGSWREDVSEIRVSRRQDHALPAKDFKIGFRCATD